MQSPAPASGETPAHTSPQAPAASSAPVPATSAFRPSTGLPLSRRSFLCALAIAPALGAATLALAGCGEQQGTDDDGVTDQASSAADGADEPSEADVYASELATSVQQAIEAVIADYGDTVSVTYAPVNASTGTVSINGETSHTSASMIKLLILACLLDQAAAGEVMLATSIEMTYDDIVGGSGVIIGWGAGACFTVKDLAYYMITASDNTAANMLIDLLGMDVINEEATKLGLTATSLQRRMMDTEAQANGFENYMSSDDAATILKMIAAGTLVNEDMSALALGFLKEQTVNAGLLDGVPSDVMVAHKTGELTAVSHDGGIVLAAYPYVLVVMTEGIDNSIAYSVIASVSQAVYDATNVNVAAEATADEAAAEATTEEAAAEETPAEETPVEGETVVEGATEGEAATEGDVTVEGDVAGGVAATEGTVETEATDVAEGATESEVIVEATPTEAEVGAEAAEAVEAAAADGETDSESL